MQREVPDLGRGPSEEGAGEFRDGDPGVLRNEGDQRLGGEGRAGGRSREGVEARCAVEGRADDVAVGAEGETPPTGHTPRLRGVVGLTHPNPRAGVEGREVVRVLHLDQLVGLRAPHDVAVRGVAPLLAAELEGDGDRLFVEREHVGVGVEQQEEVTLQAGLERDRAAGLVARVEAPQTTVAGAADVSGWHDGSLVRLNGRSYAGEGEGIHAAVAAGLLPLDRSETCEPFRSRRSGCTLLRMANDDRRERLTEAAVALLSASPSRRLLTTNLNKALFYLDLSALIDGGRTLTGSAYVALEQGPVVARYQDRLLKPLVEGGLAEQLREGEAMPVQLIVPKQRYRFLSETDLLAAKRIGDVFGRSTAKWASDFSHANPGWILARKESEVDKRPRPINMLVAMQQLADDDEWLALGTSPALARAFADADAAHEDDW